VYLYNGIFPLHINTAFDNFSLFDILFQEVVFSASGKSEGDGFGFTFAIGGYGDTLAVGVGNESGSPQSGYVKLYSKSGADWSEFQEILGDSDDEEFGRLIDLSNDGRTLVVASSTVNIYELDWTSSLNEFELYDTLDHRASQVAVSGESTGFSMYVAFTTDNGSCYIYERSLNYGFGWRGLNNPISGAWTSVALNNDGSIIILGSASDASDSAGSAFVFKLLGADAFNDWVQMGGEITPDDIEEDSFGDRETVSITSNGLTVSVGSGRGADEKGIVRVYDYDETDETWKQKGNDILGDNTEDYLAWNKMSSDGTYLVAGSPAGGYYKILQWDGTDYEVRSTVSVGVTYNHGKWVDISADGGYVASGNPSIDNGKGTIYLYETGAPADVPTGAPVDVPGDDSTDEDVPGDDSSDEVNNDSPAFHSLDYGMTSFVVSAMIVMTVFY